MSPDEICLTLDRGAVNQYIDVAHRFWEARKVWGSVTNTVRNLTRLSQSSLGSDAVTYAAMLEYVKAFPWLLKQHLQDDRNDDEIAFLQLPLDEIEVLQSSPNPPLAACQRMTQLLEGAYGAGGMGREDSTSVWYRLQLEEEIGKLVDALGMCERILTTPVPRKYSRHTSRFLTVYLLTLPIVLVPHTEYMTAPIVSLSHHITNDTSAMMCPVLVLHAPRQHDVLLVYRHTLTAVPCMCIRSAIVVQLRRSSASSTSSHKFLDQCRELAFWTPVIALALVLMLSPD
eukprot:9539-Heterococcus_DN1.PRE.2